jgi:hypothetical protein
MANHGKQRTTEQVARHYAKPSRAKRHERRWDARVKAMRDDLEARSALVIPSPPMDEITAAILNVQVQP